MKIKIPDSNYPQVDNKELMRWARNNYPEEFDKAIASIAEKFQGRYLESISDACWERRRPR